MDNIWIYPEFSSPRNMGKREWGTEELLEISSGNWSLKRLIIKAGFKGGLQYHRKKDEGGVLISGKLLCRYGKPGEILKEKIINAGESFHFPPNSIHQEEALTDCEIIEASTPHINDRVRCEKLFGIEDNGNGLPSTESYEIEIL
tara:strand:+ start:649 stop:1083 length:435 start_codon:yes stop_codon:yes gene_type:complete